MGSFVVDAGAEANSNARADGVRACMLDARLCGAVLWMCCSCGVGVGAGSAGCECLAY